MLEKDRFLVVSCWNDVDEFIDGNLCLLLVIECQYSHCMKTCELVLYTLNMANMTRINLSLSLFAPVQPEMTLHLPINKF